MRVSDAGIDAVATMVWAADGAPQVVDDGDYRRLYFGPLHIQSEMDRRDPDVLQLKYTQRMMALLLFLPRPRHILIVGLGGGSLTKFCHRQLPKTRITSIEIDARVIALARAFGVPAEDARHRIVHADAGDWLAATNERFDAVLLDGYTDSGIASGFGDPAFYDRIRECLKPEGLLVANILVGAEALRRYKRVISEAFDEQMIVQKIVPDGNNVVFAFQSLPAEPNWVAMAAEAKKLKVRHGLDFPAWVRSLRRAHERHSADAGEDVLLPLL
ncbi:fused MFS/spermidine synthase [Nevskia sp.]|uniref:fused MFS/spermidine synthase n=1 Tax=Nevskia sp. TaxID=1929292 RepID=UPI0025D6AFEF|nr:fused MFS/spermidine synthase [Nevskia sp.]